MWRLRTSYVDDWEYMKATDAIRVRILGRSVHPLTALVAMAAVVILFMVLFYVSRADWFPKSTTINWTIAGISIAVMLVAGVVSGMCIWAVAQSIRRSRMQLAKLDGATDEEARQESARFIRRNVYLRLGVYLAMSLALWFVLGSPFIFDWAGPGPYLGGLAVLLAVIMFYTSGTASRLWARLRRAGSEP